MTLIFTNKCNHEADFTDKANNEADFTDKANHETVEWTEGIIPI